MLALLNSIAYQHTAHGVAPTRIDSATLSHGFARGAIAHVKHTMRRAAPKMSRSFALPRPLQQGVTRAATHQRRRRNLRLHTYHTLSQPLPPPPRTTTLTTTPQPHTPPHAMSTPSNAMTTRPHYRRHHRRRQHLARTLTRRNRRPTTLPPPPSSHTRRPPPARNGGTHTHHHRAHTRTPSPRRLHPAPRMHEAVTAPCTCRDRSLCETQPILHTRRSLRQLRPARTSRGKHRARAGLAPRIRNATRHAWADGKCVSYLGLTWSANERACRR